MKFIEEKEQFIKILGDDTWKLLEKRIPTLLPLLMKPEGAAGFLVELPDVFPADSFERDDEAIRCWEMIGNIYKSQARFHEAISIYMSLYNQLLDAQETSGERICKGTPLTWISDCFLFMKFPVHSKRFIMLALCEDAIHGHGQVSPVLGAYWRLITFHGLSHTEVKRYGLRAYDVSSKKRRMLFSQRGSSKNLTRIG